MILLVTHGLALIAGVLIGFGIREIGHTRPMRKLRDRIRRSERVVGIALVTTALLVNALLGFLQIATRAELAEGERRDDLRLACQIRYNAEKGEALALRDRSIVASSKVERALWERIRGDVESGALTSEGLTDAISDYLDAIAELQRTRVANPYPPSDLCENVAQEADQ